jgi:hypothetical protein
LRLSGWAPSVRTGNSGHWQAARPKRANVPPRSYRLADQGHSSWNLLTVRLQGRARPPWGFCPLAHTPTEGVARPPWGFCPLAHTPTGIELLCGGWVT